MDAMTTATAKAMKVSLRLACGAKMMRLVVRTRPPFAEMAPSMRRSGGQQLRQETCNDIDDDCDGTTDEDFAVGIACAAGVGACLRDGVTVCGDNGIDTLCSVVAGPAEAEQCDGLDNDCDGCTDEFVAGLGAECEVGIGACQREGLTRCLDGAVVVRVVLAATTRVVRYRIMTVTASPMKVLI